MSEYIQNTIAMLIEKFVNFIYDTYWDNIDLLFTSFLISCSMAILIMFIELYYTNFNGSSFKRILFKRSKSTVIDLYYFLIYTSGLITLFAVLISLGIPQSISTVIKSFISFDLGFELNIYVRLVLFLLLVDFLNYWQHRFMHRIESLWEIHKFHHSAEEFNVITVFREHPMDKAINSFFMIIPGIIFVNPVGEFALFVTLYGIIGYYQHSNIPWHGFIGKYIIQSSRDHYIHHSKLEEHHDKNFGSTFAFWDHLFGTYYHGKTKPVIGLNDTTINNSNTFSATIDVQKKFIKKIFTP